MYRKVVLVVDDEPDMLTLLDVTIKRIGYVPLKASNARIALDLVRSFLPNLVVLDVSMPGMNGFELCAKIREVPHMADVPIIVFTALHTAQNEQRAINVGANAIVAKDSFPCGLTTQIKTMLNGSPPPPNH